jgi:protein-disulfide isomerase
MSKKQQFTGKRQAIREKRRRDRQRQRLITILVVVGVALVIAALLIAPSIRNSLTPVADIIEITPVSRPMVNGTAMGNPDAPVLIEVYEDFQCPACRIYSNEVEPLVTENHVANGEVYYVFRQYPFLDDRAPGNESDQAANASMCAAEQGWFWDYHDILFANWNSENQGSFSDKRLLALAEALGLDMDAFTACFEENRYQDQIQADLAAGDAAGVQGTPTVLVNGEIVRPGYVPTYEDIKRMIEVSLPNSSQ